MENKERDAQKALCLVGIITGVIFTFLGLIDGFYESQIYLSQNITMGDFRTASLYDFNGFTCIFILKAIHVLGDLLAAFGLFEICFFGIKLKELSANSNK